MTNVSGFNSAMCRLCGKPPREAGGIAGQDGYSYNCDRCGIYSITRQAYYNVASVDSTFLRAATRQASEAGAPLALTTENLDTLISDHARTSINGNLEKLVRFIGSKCGRPGRSAPIDPEVDYPIIDAQDQSELHYFLLYAAEQGLIAGDGVSRWLTPKGWAYLSGPAAGAIQGRCFIAMSFDGSLQDAYSNGILKSVEDDCGLTAVRMLELEHNDKICDRIIVELRRAQFIVADFTLHRGGVYFEAGFAAGLGRPVIWTCRACDFERLHFDTRQYNHIRWEEPNDLRTQLTARIRGTIPGAKLV